MSRCLFVAVVVFALGATSPVLAQNPLIGTWKLNIARSTFDPAPTGPELLNVTHKYEVFEGDGLRLTVERVTADGRRTRAEIYRVHFDGKDYPLTGITRADAIAFRQIDAFSWDFTLKKAGEVVATGRNVVSNDGKTMTLTSKGTTAGGQPANNVGVFDKR